MKTAGHPLPHQGQPHHRELSIIERRLIGMMLKGMGDPLLVLQCWDSDAFTHHPQVECVTVYLKSRPALWRFLLRPEITLKAGAHPRGITLADTSRFRQAIADARQHLPAETQTVNRLLGLDTDK